MKAIAPRRRSFFPFWPIAWPFAQSGVFSMADVRALVRQRQDLATLDPHLLRDIGVSAQEAASEANRPVWDVPAHWRQKP